MYAFAEEAGFAERDRHTTSFTSNVAEGTMDKVYDGRLAAKHAIYPVVPTFPLGKNPPLGFRS